MERHADLPGPGEDLRILDRHLVLNGIGIAHRVPLDKSQRVAVEVARCVEPRLVVVIGHFDDERVAFPAAARIAHPWLEAIVVLGPICVDQPVDLRPFEQHRDVIASLEDLKGPLQIHHARQPSHETLVQRVQGRPICKVFGLLLSGPRLIRDLPPSTTPRPAVIRYLDP